MKTIALKRILHRVDECPNKRFIYVFFKHKGHDVLTVGLYRFPAGDSIVGDIDFGRENAMPVAWCFAEDLLNVLGYDDSFAKFAKEYTWASYEGEDVL